jgi:hypothetical protein
MQFGDTTAAGTAKTEEIRALINSFGKRCTFFYGWRDGTTFRTTTYELLCPFLFVNFARTHSCACSGC